GYGAGSRNPHGFANVLRLNIGEAAEREGSSELVTVIETALDDSSPQVLAYVAEKALAAGALDVMLTPVVMKKGRPGTLITVLCEPGSSAQFEQLLLRETSTLGVRIRQDRRVCLERRHLPVETPYGTIRMKVGAQNGDELNAAPEFEDCRAAAERHGVALKQVQQAAIAAYRSGSR
ncbi:MAG TPA: LarC family nickel insertion protein, partial [Acidobacteriaceae bacterium]|nr:LarC family nickel insertion protein [Acidobacteriaceae bacterium]